MNLNKKGWLSDYIDLKIRNLDAAFKENKRKGIHPDQSLYALIQPTGIMYGYPVKNISEAGVLNHESHIKLLLLDTLLESYMLFYKGDSADLTAIERVENAIGEIVNFYNSVYSELYISKSSFFGIKRDDLERAERILDKRLKNSDQSGFWELFFHNSMLFLDIYLFRQWFQTSDDKMIVEYLKSQRYSLYTDVLKVMSAAAYSNANIEREERKLFEYYLNSVNLPAQSKREAKEFLEKGIGLEEVPMPNEDSWILKKYFLELAILTAWADRTIEDQELEFIMAYASRLNLSEEELDGSLMAVEGFVLDYWHELEKLQDKKDFEKISQHYIERLKKIIQKYEKTLVTVVSKKPELADRIKRAKVEQISQEEMMVLRTELIKTLEELPAFQVISLPKNFLSIQIMMSILPKDFFQKIE